MSIKYNGKLIAGKYKTQVVTDATEGNKGLIRIATLEEVNAGTDNTTAVTPKGLATKQNKLTAGTGIEITEGNVINNTQTSAEWGNIQGDITSQNDLMNKLNTKQNKLTAGTGIDITNNIISNTQTSAEWGNIQGNLSSQTDLQNALNNRADRDLSNLSTTGESKLNNLTANLANKSLTNLNTQGQLYIGKQALMSWSTPADTTGTKAFKLAEMTDVGGNNHPMGLFRWSYITSDARCHSFDILVGLEIHNGNISRQRLDIINHYGVTELRSEALKILKENLKMLYKIANTNKPVIELWQKIPVDSSYRSIKLERLYSTHGEYGTSNTDVWVMYNKSGTTSSFTTYSETGYSVITPTEAFIHQDKLTAGENIKIEGNVISSASLGHKNITNCLLEVPQMIKADIVDGTLTVYAGSRCIVPYGTDAPTYSVGDFLLGEANNNLYKIVDIQYAADIDYPVLDQPLLFYTVEVQRDISTSWVPPNATEATVRSMYLQISGDSATWVHGEITRHCTSGTTNTNTEGYSLFYNTSANTCQRLNTSQTPTQSVCSFPIMQVDYNLNNPKLNSILNIFDCVGFIGSTAYFYKNISMLMGIGKNPDGSQKNIEYTTDKLYLRTISSTTTNYFYYVGFENGVSTDPNSKKLIFDNPNTTFVGSSSLGTFINGWKMWNFRTGKWEFYSSKMNDGVPFQVYNAIFGKLWFEDGKIIRLYLNPTGMIKTDEEKGVTTSEQDSLSTMNVLASGANLNSFRKAGTYYFSSSHTPINIPTGVNGVLQVITNEERTLVKQIWFRQGTINSNDTQTWIRTYACTNTETNTYGWSDWQQLTPQFKKANPAFLKFGGMIVQGGSYKMSSNNGEKVITFPTAFSNTSYCIIAKRMGSDDNDYESGAPFGRTTTSCKIHSWGGYTYSWIAFGY